MNRELSAAVQDGKVWLERFTRLDYKAAFQSYMERYAPAYRAAMREAADLSALAEELLDTLEADRKQEKFWKRSNRVFEEKQMMVAYVTPMLLEIGEKDFEETLRNAWSRRWPKEAYRAASHKKIASGFRNTFLGIELGRRADEDEDE